MYFVTFTASSFHYIWWNLPILVPLESHWDDQPTVYHLINCNYSNICICWKCSMFMFRIIADCRQDWMMLEIQNIWIIFFKRLAHTQNYTLRLPKKKNLFIGISTKCEWDDIQNWIKVRLTSIEQNIDGTKKETPETYTHTVEEHTHTLLTRTY